MFEPQELKVILQLIGRAPCKGDEALVIAQLQQKIVHEIQKTEAPKTQVPVVEDDNGDD